MSSTDPDSAAPGGRAAAGWRRLRVTVVGNPGLDTLVLVGQDDVDLRTDGYFVHNVDRVGHAPAFVARGLARLGHDVRILGAVGDDAIGRLVTDALARDGVDTCLLFTDPAGTPRSVNLIFPDGRRTFFYDGGAHMTLQPPVGLVEAALDGADLVVSSLPNWGRTVLARASTAGIPVAVDLQDVRAVDDPYRTDFIDAADYLFASAAHLPDPVAAAATWLGAGHARSVVLGQGAAGALLVSRRAEPTGHHRDSLIHRTGHQQPPPQLGPDDVLPVVDTTGAGDSLAIGFLDGLLALGLDPVDALHRGQLLARIAASDTGGDALFDRLRLDALMGSAPPPHHS